MEERYTGSTTDGAEDRYVLNKNGDIYKCRFTTFADSPDMLYPKLPEWFAGKKEADGFPSGCWDRPSTYGTAEEAWRGAIAAKKQMIEQKRRLIAELDKKIRAARMQAEGIASDIKRLRWCKRAEDAVHDCTKQ